MKSALIAISALLCFATTSLAQEKKVEPHPVTATFYLSHVECSSCVEQIKYEVGKVAGVTAVELDEDHPFARISFDSHVASYHQIAHAIVISDPTIGTKYDPTLKLKIPDYAKGDNAAKIDAIFAKAKTEVFVVVLNKEKGEFGVHFLPLKLDAARKGPQGWNLGKFWHPVHDEAPKGLGLAITPVNEAKVP